MSRSNRTSHAATAGVAVAACAACCAGPIVGFLAAAGLFTALGVAGLLGLVPAGIWLATRRRRRHEACRAPEAPAPVELSRRP